MATRAVQQRQSFGGVLVALENNSRLLAVPAGGTSGQVLAKTSNTDFQTAWTTPSAGGALVPTAVQTTAYTASAGQLVLANATSAAFTVTLPAAPAAATQVAVKKTDTSANGVTVAAGAGATIDAGGTTVVLAASGSLVTLVYDTTATTWRTAATGDSRDLAAGGLVPAGGTSGQVLTKNTGTDYDASWTTAASSGGGGGGIPWTGGRWFTAGANTAMGSQTSYAQSNNLCLLPIYVPNACTINQISMGSSTTSVTVRAALYNDGGSSVTSLGPTTMIGTQVTGTVTNSTTTATTFAVTGWVIPAAGIYWLALGVSSSSGMTTVGYQIPYSANPPGGVVSPYRYTTAYSYSSAFPATLATTATLVSTSASPPAYNFPIVGFQAT